VVQITHVIRALALVSFRSSAADFALPTEASCRGAGTEVLASRGYTSVTFSPRASHSAQRYLRLDLPADLFDRNSLGLRLHFIYGSRALLPCGVFHSTSSPCLNSS